MVNYDHVQHAIRQRVTVTQFRRHMAHYIAMVRYGDDYICIQRRGHEPVFLVSQADMDLIWERRDDLESGPRDAKGHRRGFGLLYWLRRLRQAEISADPAERKTVEVEMAASRFGEGRGVTRPKALQSRVWLHPYRSTCCQCPDWTNWPAVNLLHS